jgi:type IV pilus assembly protein PilB
MIPPVVPGKVSQAQSDSADPDLPSGISTSPKNSASANAPSVLTRALVRAGILSPMQESAIDHQTPRCPVIDQILQTGCITSTALASFCADTFGYICQDLAQYDLSQCPVDLIDARLMQSHTLAPLAINGKRLTVAISDPSNLQALDQIKFQTQLMIAPVVADHYALLA